VKFFIFVLLTILIDHQAITMNFLNNLNGDNNFQLSGDNKFSKLKYWKPKVILLITVKNNTLNNFYSQINKKAKLLSAMHLKKNYNGKKG